MADTTSSGALPEVNFSTFVISMASSALAQMGEVPDPVTGKCTCNALMARHAIDTLCMLEEKINKGLTPDEQNLLTSVIYELRMKYVYLCEKSR